ncbi:hypothetical protein GLGCALEP_02767 [Pseudomonas sp. MM221]|nr:hypothetical protein GLGCALEP_02767 [Pseudomonas sp. MM221]
MIQRCLRQALLLLPCLLLPLVAAADEPCRRLTATGNPEYPLTCGATRRTLSG